MQEILGITADPRQKISFVLDDNTTLNITLEFSSNVQNWICSLDNEDFVLNNSTLVVSPNMLRKYRHIIKFGLACLSTDGLDPNFVEDFENGRIRLFVLDESDLDFVEETIYNG